MCTAIKPTPQDYWLNEELNELPFDSCLEASEWLLSNPEAGFAIGNFEVKYEWEPYSGKKKKFTITASPSPTSAIVVSQPSWPDMSYKQSMDMSELAVAMYDHEKCHLYLNANLISALPPVTIYRVCRTNEDCEEIGIKLADRYEVKWKRMLDKANKIYDDITQHGVLQQTVGAFDSTYTEIECQYAEILPVTLPNGNVGEYIAILLDFVLYDYEQTPVDKTILDNVTWVHNSGRLPNGLEFSKEDGIISGTPSEGGKFEIHVTATADNPNAPGDLLSESKKYILYIKVHPAEPAISIYRYDFIKATTLRKLSEDSAEDIEGCTIYECSQDPFWGVSNCGAFNSIRSEHCYPDGVDSFNEMPSKLYGVFSDSVTVDKADASSSTNVYHDGTELLWIKGTLQATNDNPEPDIGEFYGWADTRFSRKIYVPDGMYIYRIEWQCTLKGIYFGYVFDEPIVNEWQQKPSDPSINCTVVEGLLQGGRFYELRVYKNSYNNAPGIFELGISPYDGVPTNFK